MIDHRKLGRELDLYYIDPMIGAGLPVWLPAGAAARHAIEEFVREEERLAGYQHVYSPPIGKQELFARSGHLAKFGEEMFPPMRGDEGDRNVAWQLRPSLCPHHALVFASRGRSYRDLPLRIAELGGQYRAERSGVVGGLSRVRAMQLNDAHIFCRLDQVGDEVAAVLRLMRRAHLALGVVPQRFRLSLRGENVLGEPAQWDRAEGMLRDALAAQQVSFDEAPGEAAFYGPKIDVQVLDHLGREWSLATVQIDFAQPERFGLEYKDARGERQRPVMVHRSIVGSLERLFAHLIERHEGAFPAWFAPVQLCVAPVAAGQEIHAAELVDRANRAGLRAELSARGSLGARVSEALRRKVPYIAVIGARDAAAGLVSLRLRDGRQLPAMPAAEVLTKIKVLVDSTRLDLWQ